MLQRPTALASSLALVMLSSAGVLGSEEETGICTAFGEAIDWKLVTPTDLEVTNGKQDLKWVDENEDGDLSGGGLFSITGPQCRASVKNNNDHNEKTAIAAKLLFTFQGKSTSDKPLASGSVRRQIGLKIANSDPCNLLYVMWELFPTERIMVLSKSNPGKQTSSECGAGGYTRLWIEKNIDTARSSGSHSLVVFFEPLLRIGGTNKIRLPGSRTSSVGAFRLRVCADDHTVIDEKLHNLPAEIQGPGTGFRTDNGSFEFQLYTTAVS